jgi:hypothetical protein
MWYAISPFNSSKMASLQRQGTDSQWTGMMPPVTHQLQISQLTMIHPKTLFTYGYIILVVACVYWYNHKPRIMLVIPRPSVCTLDNCVLPHNHHNLSTSTIFYMFILPCFLGYLDVFGGSRGTFTNQLSLGGAVKRQETVPPRPSAEKRLASLQLEHQHGTLNVW